MAVLFDTSYFLHLLGVGVEAINRDALNALLEEETPHASEAQVLELLLVGEKYIRKGRLTVDSVVGGIAALRKHPVVPLSPDVARTSLSLFSILRDPFDAVILASAICHDLTLVTMDRRILAAARTPVVRSLRPDLKVMTL